MADMHSLLKKAEETHLLNADELSFLLRIDDDKPLLATADDVRRRFVGDAVHLRGLIEFSNICKNNCLYCGIRRGNARIERFRFETDDIVAFARNAKALGYETVVMQSGESEAFGVDEFCGVLKKIKSFDMAITLSIGEKSFEEYRAYRQAGADRYLLRIETTDKDLYQKLDPQMDWNNRKRCLNDLKTLGYEVGSGCLIGLPGQSVESIANDILFLKEIGVDMAGIGPFIPHPDTPLKDCEATGFRLSLRTMALTRLLLPDINIPATTAMETLHPQGRLLALQSGANVVMLNVAEDNRRALYALYPNKAGIRDVAADARKKIEQTLAQAGRTVGTGKGFRGGANVRR